MGQNFNFKNSCIYTFVCISLIFLITSQAFTKLSTKYAALANMPSAEVKCKGPKLDNGTISDYQVHNHIGSLLVRP